MPDYGCMAKTCNVMVRNLLCTVDIQVCLFLSVDYIVLGTQWGGCTHNCVNAVNPRTWHKVVVA
jgi:hypothetical protein